MASPRLAVLATALTASVVMGAATGVAAPPSPSPSPSTSPSTSPTPSPSTSPSTTPTPSSALARITDQVHAALRGNTARHADYKITIAGLGAISHAPNVATAPASNEKLLTTIALLEQVGPSYRYETHVSGT